MAESKVHEVYVKFVPRSATRDSLHEFFAEIGEICRVYCPVDPSTEQNRGFAYIIFKEHAAAESCVNEWNGCELDGKHLVISWALEDPRKKAEKGPSVCFDWQKFGSCRFGDSCRFSHADGTTVAKSSKVCYDWKKGLCKFGGACRFAHSEDDDATGNSQMSEQKKLADPTPANKKQSLLDDDEDDENDAATDAPLSKGNSKGEGTKRMREEGSGAGEDKLPVKKPVKAAADSKSEETECAPAQTPAVPAEKRPRGARGGKKVKERKDQLKQEGKIDSKKKARERKALKLKLKKEKEQKRAQKQAAA
ncbi:hypothetical protein CYMTET_25891 [Cymbomonas tetramitiformis]|uniref:Uncharacterized protein n=1 Tax=Cymbomonas tetramitiformis TaxID=36881 RepID=A0AAE0FTH2_9CHLO|nr:hypothetical protein CYMTET_25891 [Cymbomonas tetramitiformis]|eukprot:gene5642-6826_t